MAGGDELAKLEAEHAELGRRVTERRRQLPVERSTSSTPRTARRRSPSSFDGAHSPDYELGACPGCSNLEDELDAARVHLTHRDVTLICFSRAPFDRLIA
jgi:Bacterial protein of unknown function (DUF899)